ncbi:MAG: hypothetical protein U9P70_04190 [Patescibacteria group bacterium]|nr:hypothetical protein [Patescibacteria group bacterium]
MKAFEFIAKYSEKAYIALVIKEITALTIKSLCYIEIRSAEIIEEINRFDEQTLDAIATMISDSKTNKIKEGIKTLEEKLDNDINRKGRQYHLSKGEKTYIFVRIDKLKCELKKIS